jgi:asparagine synthase (glutamine-hydrolysing)
MPGMSFICDLQGGLQRDQVVILRALESLIHDERYQRHEWLHDDVHFLGSTAYREYPIRSFEVSDTTIYLEGRWYGENTAVHSRRLHELADLAFTADGAQDRMVEWLRKTDGDFVALIFHRQTGDIVIINDIFGRLPLYCYQTTDRLILSRELRFITQLMGNRRFDRMAIAQHLLVGYPLGKRTLLENVDRLPPATCIRISTARSEIHVDQLCRFNCESKADSEKSVKDNARQLAGLFAQSCATRAAPDGQNVISLSGGFDSRAIAACFHKMNIPFRAATFLDPARRAESDVAIARQVASLFDSEWELLWLDPPPARDVLKLLRLKNGMNPLYMSFLLAFLDQIRTSHGSDLVFISGEIGDRVLPDRRPSDNFESVEETVDSIVNQEPKFSLETVSALTGLKPTDIVDELQHHVSSYPEQDWAQKYVHFVTYERVFKWLCEGEDRNRNYFWNATPYSAIEFFNFAMACPDEQKSYYGLYREFLLELSPEAAAIEHAGTGAAITSNRFQTVRKALKFLQERSDLRGQLQTVMGPPQGYDHDTMTLACLRQQMMDGDVIFEYLSASSLRNIVNHYTSYTKEAIDLLFTVTATIEELLTGKSVLEQCACTRPMLTDQFRK